MKRSILVTLVLGLALAGCNTSYNYFEDDDENAPDPGPFNLAHSLMKHTGVVPSERQRIAYKPRAPLALPSSSELPTPQERNAPNAAEAAVNFPVDQGEQDKQRKAALAAAFQSGQSTSDASGGTASTTTRNALVRLPAEAVEQPKPTRNGDPNQRNDDVNPARSLKEMRKKLNFRAPAESLLTEDGKAAPRKYLIQPPDKYRTPAETAALPEEGDIENSEWIDKQLYRDVDRGNVPLIK